MEEEYKLIENCQKGSPESFGELFDLYNRKIYNFLYFRIHHKQTAEDLTSIVFTKSFQKIRQFDLQKGKFSTWLYQIAKNTLTDHFRTFKPGENIEDIWDLSSATNIERDTDTVLALEKVKAHIKELPALQRDILVMRLWDGMSHKEIAEVLNISEGNSKVNFSRGIAKLREKVDISYAIIILAIKFLNINF